MSRMRCSVARQWHPPDVVVVERTMSTTIIFPVQCPSPPTVALNLLATTERCLGTRRWHTYLHTHRERHQARNILKAVLSTRAYPVGFLLCVYLCASAVVVVAVAAANNNNIESKNVSHSPQSSSVFHQKLILLTFI